MKDGDVLTWTDVASVFILSGMWARIGMRGDPWDRNLPWKERKFGASVLLQIADMLWWDQDMDELDDEGEQESQSWLDMQGPQLEDV